MKDSTVEMEEFVKGLEDKADAIINEGDSAVEPVMEERDGVKVVPLPPKVMAQFSSLMHGILQVQSHMSNEIADVELELLTAEKEAEGEKTAIRAKYNIAAVRLSRKVDQFLETVVAKYRPPFFPWKMDSERGGLVYDKDSVSTEEQVRRQQLAKQGITFNDAKTPNPPPAPSPVAPPAKSPSLSGSAPTPTPTPKSKE